MRISAIQNQVNYQRTLPKTNSRRVASENPQTQPTAPSFKGMNGGLAGLGTGLTLGILGFGASIISGLALPLLLVEAAMVGAGAVGAAAGSKIEDKIKGTKED